MKKILIFIIFIASGSILANNLSVTNISLENQSAGSHTFVQFDISWDNSWRGGTDNGSNWDAAWIFIKYKVSGGAWNHATLNSTGHTAPTGSTIDVSSDGKGAFIYRSSDGTGTNTWTDAELRWNYNADGLGDADQVTVKVFAVEMVYIPEGSFYLGDGTSSNITAHFEDATSGNSVQITGEGSLTLGGGGVGSIGNNNKAGQNTTYGEDDFDDATSQTLPAAFPKGFDAFYIMKYEVSANQYSQFLNCLTRTQQNTRTLVNISGTSVSSSNVFVMAGTGAKRRTAVRCSTTLPAAPTPIETWLDFNADDTAGDGGDIPCNYLSWDDGKAISDWSALRPMTEFEFEKACRGADSNAVAGEYAWGTTSITSTRYTISNAGANNESVTLDNSVGNASYSSTYDVTDVGAMRCGIFAGTSGTRVKSGAGYYGVMEMSGNLTEQVVTVSSSDTRGFTGVHGDGTLNATGNADATNWPIYKGLKGHSFDDSDLRLRVSDRYWSLIDVGNPRIPNHGFRAVRTAP